MAIAIALPGFNYLGRSVIPIFLLMDHFLYRFSTFSEKNEENLLIRGLNFLHHRIPFFSALRLSMRRFQMLLEGLSFVKTLATFEIINATYSLIQNITRIVCLRKFIFDPGDHADLRAPIFQNQGSFPHDLSLKRSP